MRTLTALQTAALATPYRSVRFRVFVDSTGGGVYQDLTNLQGYDWIQEVSYDHTVDQPVSACQLKLYRAVFNLSLNPYMGASKLNNGTPMLAIGRRMYVETLTTPLDVPYQASQWVRVFEGYIDTIDPGSETVQVDCRDLGALLTDTFIEVERNYGSAMGTAIQTVMQQILDDNINTPGLGSVTLYVPSSPTFLLLQYKQSKTHVFDALTSLADQIGWGVRYKWDSGTSQFRLTLDVPGRANTTADYTFGPDDYYDITSFQVSRKDIRNVVQIVYDDKSNSGLRQKVQVNDTASIAAYGRRFMEIGEAATSQIDTSAEATNMANAALSDLSQPFADHAVSLDYFFPSQLGDLYAFLPNGKHYDATQKLAVVGIKHDLTADGKTLTTLTCRGKPSVSYKRWLRIEGRPGVGPNAGFFDPATPASVNVYTALGTVIVDVSPVDQANWTRTEVFMDTSAVPMPSPATINGKNAPLPSGILVAKGKYTRFSLPGLIPGKVYYGRVQVIDKDGNRSAPSGQFSVQTERTGAYHDNLDGTAAILNANSDFNEFTKGLATFPDAWGGIDASTTWGASQIIYYNTSAASGKFCLQLCTGGYSGQKGGIRTNGGPPNPAYVPFAAKDIVTGAAWIKWDMPAPFTYLSAAMDINFYSATVDPTTGIPTFTFLYTYTVARLESATAATGWYLGFNFSANAPANAQYVSVTLRRYGSVPDAGAGYEWGSSGTYVPALYIDRITLVRGQPALSSMPSTVGELTISANTATPVTSYDGTHTVALGFAVPVDTSYAEWTCLIPCTMSFTFGFQVQSLNVDPTLFSVWLEVYDPIGAVWNIVVTTNFKLNQYDQQNVTISSTAIVMPINSRIRGMIQETHEAHVHYQTVSLVGVCISRGDI